MFKPALLVMNPRRIPRALKAIASLKVDKFWLSFMWERELEPVIAKIVERTDYTHFVFISDDCVPTQAALDLVLAELEKFAGEPACLTGYCNNFVGSPHVNITSRPFEHPDRVVGADYAWYTRAEIEEAVRPLTRSWFAGMALTGLARSMMIRFPFQTITEVDPRGYCSDWSLSTRLQRAGIPIYGVRGAFVEHLATEKRSEQGAFDPKHHEMKLLVGLVHPEVRWDRGPFAEFPDGANVTANLRRVGGGLVLESLDSIFTMFG